MNFPTDDAGQLRWHDQRHQNLSTIDFLEPEYIWALITGAGNVALREADTSAARLRCSR